MELRAAATVNFGLSGLRWAVKFRGVRMKKPTFRNGRLEFDALS
jgi:hypothetical protein